MHLKRFGGRQTGSPAGGRPGRPGRPAELQSSSPDRRPGRLGTAEHPRSPSLYTPRNARAAALSCLSPTKPGPAQRSRSDSAPGRGKRPSSGRSRVSPGTRRNVGQGPLPPPDSPPRPAPFSAPLRLPASRPRRSGPSQRTAGRYGAGLPLAPRPAKGEQLLFPDYPKASSASKMSHSIFGPGASSLMPVPRLAAARRAALCPAQSGPPQPAPAVAFRHCRPGPGGRPRTASKRLSQRLPPPLEGAAEAPCASQSLTSGNGPSVQVGPCFPPLPRGVQALSLFLGGAYLLALLPCSGFGPRPSPTAVGSPVTQPPGEKQVQERA